MHLPTNPIITKQELKSDALLREASNFAKQYPATIEAINTALIEGYQRCDRQAFFYCCTEQEKHFSVLLKAAGYSFQTILDKKLDRVAFYVQLS